MRKIFSAISISMLLLALAFATVRADEEPVLVIQRGHSNDCTAFAFSADGRYLVSGSHDRTVKIWDTTSRALLRTLTGHGLSVSSVALSTDEKLLASVSWDGVLRLWSFPGGELLNAFAVDIEDGLEDVVFSEDSQFVYARTRNKIVRSVSVETGEISDSYIPSSEHPQFSKETGAFDRPDYVRDPWVMRLNSDGTILATGYADGSFRLYEYPSLITLLAQTQYHSGITSLRFSPDSSLLAIGGIDNSIILWNIDEQYIQNRFNGIQPTNTTIPFSSFAWSPKGDYFALSMGRGGGGGWIEIWDAYSGIIKTSINDLAARAADIGISPDGKYMYVVCSTSLKAYELEIRKFPSGELIHRLGTNQQNAAFSRDSRFIISSDYDRTVVSSVESGEMIRVFPGASNVISVAPDGNLVALDQFSYSIDSGEFVSKTEFSITAFSPDGNLAAGLMENELGIISLEDGKTLYSLGVEIGYPWKTVFSPDGRFLLAAAGYNIMIWSVKTGDLVKTLEGHFLDVDDIDFSPNGKIMVTSSDDATYRFWDTSTWNNPATLFPISEGQWIAYTEDGHFEDSGSNYKFIRWRTGNDVFESFDLYEKHHRYGLIYDIMNGE